MKARLDIALDLLHGADEASLATLSVAAGGHPFASLVPFALDASRRPVLLLSSLAEHSRNLDADARASLLVARSLGDGEIARVTLVGTIERCKPDAALRDRYLRYHPAAERFLQLGDFGFRRFLPQRLYVVGGFAQAGWLEGERLTGQTPLDPSVEESLIRRFQPALPPECRLLGIDPCGIDLRQGVQRVRQAFPQGTLTGAALEEGVAERLRESAIT